MKRMLTTLFGAALVMAFLAVPVLADETDSQDQMTRSLGAHPVVYDDYPESEVVISITDDIVLTVTGEARTRFEWVENNTDFSDDGLHDFDADDDFFDDEYTFAPARFNLGFRVDLPRDVAAVIELEGAFDFGGNDATATHARANVNQSLRPGAANWLNGAGAFNRLGGSGGTSVDLDEARFDRDQVSSSDSVHVYQGYIEAAKIGDSIFSLRFGRQELAYGTEFLLGNQDWYDGMSYDGIKGIFQFTDNARLDLFWAKVTESQLDGFAGQDDNDITMYGAYASIQSLGGSSIGLDAYAIGEIDNRDLVYNLDVDITGDDDLILDTTSFPLTVDAGSSFKDIWWVGLRLFREREHGLHFSVEGTYQFGEFEADHNDADGDDRDHLNIDAAAFEGSLGWTFNTPTNPNIHAGLTWASGSDISDYNDGDYRTFFTPGGEIHPRLGLMDLVEASNIAALNLGYAGASGNHSWGVDLWWFELDEVAPEVNEAVLGNGLLDDRDGDGLSEELGAELDLQYNYQYSKNMVAQFAIGFFDAGDYFRDINECATGDCDEDLIADDDEVLGTDDAWRVYANLLVRF